MSLWGWQLTVVTDTAAARPHNSLVSVKMNLSLELVPQLVMLRTLHPATQQLDLLYSAYHTLISRGAADNRRDIARTMLSCKVKKFTIVYTSNTIQFQMYILNYRYYLFNGLFSIFISNPAILHRSVTPIIAPTAFTNDDNK